MYMIGRPLPLSVLRASELARSPPRSIIRGDADHDLADHDLANLNK